MNLIFAQMFHLCQLWLLVVKLFPFQWFFEHQYWSQALTVEPTSTATQWTGDRCAWAQVTEGRRNNTFKLIFFQSWRMFSLRGFAIQPRIYVYFFPFSRSFSICFICEMNEEQKLDIKTATKLKRRRYDPQSRFPIAVIAVEPAGKASFVLGCIQTRLMGQYNGKWPISLVYMSKPLITVITAIALVECWIIWMWHAFEKKHVLLCKNNNVKLQQFDDNASLQQ